MIQFHHSLKNHLRNDEAGSALAFHDEDLKYRNILERIPYTRAVIPIPIASRCGNLGLLASHNFSCINPKIAASKIIVEANASGSNTELKTESIPLRDGGLSLISPENSKESLTRPHRTPNTRS